MGFCFFGFGDFSCLWLFCVTGGFGWMGDGWIVFLYLYLLVTGFTVVFSFMWGWYNIDFR